MVLSPLPCPHCGACDVPAVAKGTSMHALRANCAHCGRYLKWLPKSLVEKDPQVSCLSINKVILCGHISRYGVSVKYATSGTPCASFVLVLSEQGSDLKVRSTYVDCEVWGKHAEEVGELEAGQLALFEGKVAKRKKGDQWEMVVSGYDCTAVLPAQATLTGNPN